MFPIKVGLMRVREGKASRTLQRPNGASQKWEIGMDLRELMMQAEPSGPELPAVAPEVTALKLKHCLKEISAPRSFKRGDLVILLPYAPYKLPLKGQPAIVKEVLDPPRIETERDSNSWAYQLPMDLIVGCIAPDGCFCPFHVSSIFFVPYTGPVAEEFNVDV